MWRSFYTTLSSVFLSVGPAYIANDLVHAFSIGAHFEIPTKSNNVRTGRPRITKVSGVVVLDDPTLHTQHGSLPHSSFAARGR